MSWLVSNQIYQPAHLELRLPTFLDLISSDSQCTLFEIYSYLYNNDWKAQEFSVTEYLNVTPVTHVADDFEKCKFHHVRPSKKNSTGNLKLLIEGVLKDDRVLQELETFSQSISESKGSKWLVPTMETIACIAKTLRKTLGNIYLKFEESVF